MRRIASFILIAVAAVFFGAYLARDSYVQAQKEKAKANAAHQKMIAAENSRIELIQQKAELQSKSGREKIARDRGYMKPGESDPSQ